jgi:hypothetical protein
VQLLFAHHCSHSDCSLFRCTLVTADRCFCQSRRFTSLASFEGSTVDSTVYHTLLEGAHRCVDESCTAGCLSANFRPPAHFCRVASSRAAPIPRRADARATRTTTVRSKATASRCTTQSYHCPGPNALPALYAARSGLSAMQRPLRRSQALAHHLR